jgi:hypothetical protein
MASRSHRDIGQVAGTSAMSANGGLSISCAKGVRAVTAHDVPSRPVGERIGRVSKDDTARLDAIITRRPELSRTRSLVRGFGEMVTNLTNLTGKHLPTWLAHVERDGEPELRTLAKEYDATWPPSPPASPCPAVPGPSKATSTVKMIKRQMYGRAGFDPCDTESFSAADARSPRHGI